MTADHLPAAVQPTQARNGIALALSGGGYRGLFSAHVLERIHPAGGRWAGGG